MKGYGISTYSKILIFILVVIIDFMLPQNSEKKLSHNLEDLSILCPFSMNCKCVKGKPPSLHTANENCNIFKLKKIRNLYRRAN